MGEVERLKSHREFVAVLQRRRRVSDHDIVVHYRLREGNPDGVRVVSGNRMGLAVSKAVGNAVVRNHVKRRFRVLAAAHEGLLPENCDIVMRAKPSAATASFQSLDAQVARLFADVRAKASRQ